MEKIIRRLGAVQFPMELEPLCKRIGLPGEFIAGRTQSQKEPPFEWTTVLHFHPRYGLKLKINPSELNESQDFVVHDMKIWKKTKEMEASPTTESNATSGKPR